MKHCMICIITIPVWLVGWLVGEKFVELRGRGPRMFHDMLYLFISPDLDGYRAPRMKR